MTDLMQQLKTQNEAFKKAEPQQGGSDDFPDGNYVVSVEKAALVAVKGGQNAGKPQIQWWLRVVDGPKGTVNRIVFHYHRLFGEDPDKQQLAFGRLKTDLGRVGYPLEDFEALPATLDAMIALIIKVSLKTGSTAGIQNCYFNSRASE